MEDNSSSSSSPEVKTAQIKKPRDRRANSSVAETSALVSEYRKVQSALENPKISLTSKHKLWEGIAYRVSEVGNCKRTVQNIKNKWNNMTRQSKNANIAYKKSFSQTGGGPPVPEPSPLQQEIIDMFVSDPRFNGIDGAMESSLGDKPSSVTESCDGNIVVSLPDSVFVEILEKAEEEQNINTKISADDTYTDDEPKTGTTAGAKVDKDLEDEPKSGSGVSVKSTSKCPTEPQHTTKSKRRSACFHRITQDMVLEAQYHFFRAQTALAEKQAILAEVQTAYYRKALDKGSNVPNYEHEL